jgi:hypothetical protein
MVDADMGFQPSLVMRMLKLQRGICAACYPKRNIDLGRLIAMAREARPDSSVDEILAKAYEFDCEGDSITEALPDGAHRFDVHDGFVRATAAGSGIMLISRPAMTTLYTTYPELRATDIPRGPVGLKEAFFQPFNQLVLENGVVLSEDISFCRRWVDGCGGDIWVNLDEVVTHQGAMTYQSRFWDRLMASRV